MYLIKSVVGKYYTENCKWSDKDDAATYKTMDNLPPSVMWEGSTFKMEKINSYRVHYTACGFVIAETIKLPADAIINTIPISELRKGLKEVTPTLWEGEKFGISVSISKTKKWDVFIYEEGERKLLGGGNSLDSAIKILYVRRSGNYVK